MRRARLPLVSGKTSVAVLLLCLAVTGVWIIPLAHRWPPWLDVEIVLGLWWVVWAVTLARLLYTGRRISDDHALGSPRNWFSSSKSGSASASSGSGWGWLDLSFTGLDGCAVEGCASVLAVVAVAAVALFGLWLLIEVLIPTLAFVMYFLVRGVLAKVANDEHGCEGKLLRAAAWGSLWAAVYIAPLGILVWVIHVLHKPPAV